MTTTDSTCDQSEEGESYTFYMENIQEGGTYWEMRISAYSDYSSETYIETPILNSTTDGKISIPLPLWTLPDNGLYASARVVVVEDGVSYAQSWVACDSDFVELGLGRP